MMELLLRRTGLFLIPGRDIGLCSWLSTVTVTVRNPALHTRKLIVPELQREVCNARLAVVRLSSTFRP